MSQQDVKIDEQYLRLRIVECGECWEWKHSYTTSGIPLLPRKDGKAPEMVRVKVATDILKRKVRKGHIASTKCENRRCVRPQHVAIITRAQMLERTRKNTNNQLRIAKITAARRATSKVMTMEKAAAIQASTETVEALGKQHNIHPSMAHKIKTGKAWAPQNPLAGLFSGLVAANDHNRRRA